MPPCLGEYALIFECSVEPVLARSREVPRAVTAKYTGAGFAVSTEVEGNTRVNAFGPFFCGRLLHPIIPRARCSRLSPGPTRPWQALRAGAPDYSPSTRLRNSWTLRLRRGHPTSHRRAMGLRHPRRALTVIGGAPTSTVGRRVPSDLRQWCGVPVVHRRVATERLPQGSLHDGAQQAVLGSLDGFTISLALSQGTK